MGNWNKEESREKNPRDGVERDPMGQKKWKEKFNMLLLFLFIWLKWLCLETWAKIDLLDLLCANVYVEEVLWSRIN